jgi:hypothetical protein
MAPHSGDMDTRRAYGVTMVINTTARRSSGTALSTGSPVYNVEENINVTIVVLQICKSERFPAGGCAGMGEDRPQAN